MAVVILTTIASSSSSGNESTAVQVSSSGKNTATLARAPAQSFDFATACSSLQLVSDGEGSTLQLQKRQIKECQCSWWQLMYCRPYHWCNLFLKKWRIENFCLHTFFGSFLFDFAVYDVTYNFHWYVLPHLRVKLVEV